MIIECYEVYGQDNNLTAIFLTEKEAKKQTMIQPTDGLFKRNIDLSEEEIEFLNKHRYLWGN